MALEHASLPLFGVQFHPESVATSYGDALFANFRDLVAERAGLQRGRFVAAAAVLLREEWERGVAERGIAHSLRLPVTSLG